MNWMETRKKRAKAFIVPIVLLIVLAGVLTFQECIGAFVGGFLDGYNGTQLMEPR